MFTLVLGLSSSLPALAASVRMQGLVSALNAEFSVRSNTALFLGTDSFSFGPFLVAEKPHSYLQDIAAGIAFRTGSVWSFELGCGVLSRTFESSSGRGVWGHAMLARKISGPWTVSFVLNGKNLVSGDLEKRLILELYPQVGASWNF